MAQQPAMTRLVLEHPQGTKPGIKDGPGGIEIRYEGAFVLNENGEKPKLAPGMAAYETVRDERSLTIRLKAAAGFVPRAFAEADTVVVDLAKPALAAATPPVPAPVVPAAPEARSTTAPGAAPAPPARPEPVAAAPKSTARPDDAPASHERAVPMPAPRPPAPPGVITPVTTFEPDGASILFPFRSRTAAAAYERGGLVTVVFETADRLSADALADRAGLLKDVALEAEDGLLVLRLPGSTSGPARLSADGQGWRLSLGGGAALPPDALKVSRALDENGHGLVLVALPMAAKVHWLREPDGQRLAIVTAFGRVQAIPVAKGFVEFGLPAALHGVVVEPRADDLVVGLGRGGATITREAGLSLSSPGRLSPAGTDMQQIGGLVLTRDGWVSDTSGKFLERWNDLVSEAANAPQSGRAEARYRYGRFLLANGLNEEASGVLALARAEDPVFARRRETVLLSGIAAARAGRSDQARALLGSDILGDDPEAVLWRAVVDAADRRWSQATAGFRRSLDVVDLYPDELAGPIRLAILGAAIEMGDVPRAEGELAAIDRLAAGSIARDDHDLARARVDEAAARIPAALRAYEKLIEDAAIPAASEATRRWVSLAQASGALERDAAIDRLESLSVAWRGGETEIGTISELARLYGEAKRWRDMFEMTRRASRYYPDHDLTRRLHDGSARMLEELMLGAEGEKLSAVQTLGLYFDFKDLAPVGRRGDEIVRRLADRLVELDLLDQAADLLQHQVDNRLTGVARATVAARLAAIRLMNGKPLLALSALQSTRFSGMPEDVRRFRFLLEARAQSDLSRSELALELIDGETGADFDRLRVGVLWTARRWREAGEASEALLRTRWNDPGPLSDRDRSDIIRAAVAYGMADERIATERLKQKFGRKMLDSPDAKTFEFLMRPGAAQTREFRTIVQEASRQDGLKQLLSERGNGHADGPNAPPVGTSSTEPTAVPGAATEGARAERPASAPG